MNNWQEQLQHWKDTETASPVMALTDIAQMKTVLWAMTQSHIKWEPGEYPKGLNDQELWREAWKHSSYDASEIAMIAATPIRQCVEMINRIIAVRLAHPDGTINKNANVFINAYIKRKIKEAAAI